MKKHLKHHIHKHRQRSAKAEGLLVVLTVILFAASFVIFSYTNVYINSPQQGRLMDPKVYKQLTAKNYVTPQN